MSERPETRYAKTTEGIHVAYQVVGDGPRDLVFLPEWRTHLETIWEEPSFAQFVRRLGSFSRVILLDKRGTGLSDPVSPSDPPTLENWVDDVRAVLAAVGSNRAVIFGCGGGGPLAILVAATCPESVSGLVLFNTYASYLHAIRVPSGLNADFVERAREVLHSSSAHFPSDLAVMVEGEALDWLKDSWGHGASLILVAPSMGSDDRFRDWHGRWERLSVSPAMAAATQTLRYRTDLRGVLPTVNVPTLVMHRVDNRYISLGAGRYLAEHLSKSSFVELAGADHLCFVGDVDAVLDEVAEFVTGSRASASPSRMLATIMFTDIVESTKRASAIGDRAWGDRVGAHDAMIRRQLERFRGHEIKTMGDGFLVSFDGPARAIQCACAIRDGAHQLEIEVRVGLHTGEVEVRTDDVSGVAVNIGARVMALAGPGEVLVSRTVTDLVAGSGIQFEDRGEHELKGVPGAWRLFTVSSA